LKEKIRNAINEQLLENYDYYLDCAYDENDFMLYCKDEKAIKYNSPLEEGFHFYLKESIKNGSWNISILPDFDIIHHYKIDDYIIDFVIQTKDKKLNIAIEIDGFTYHDRNEKQFTYERQRQNNLVNKGYKILRYTYTDILKNINKCILDIEILLKDWNNE
jgi:very-short-patch-repair endonuclease